MKKIFFILMCLILLISSVHAARLPTVGGDSDAWGTVLNEYLNTSLGENATSLNISQGNLSLGQKITFALGEIIDNLVDGWIKINGGLNVSENATFNGYVGIGTENPSVKLDVEVSSGGAATIGSSGNIATGDYAIAIGYNTTTSGDSSTAMGYRTTASGDYSTAMGHTTIASGDYSTAMSGYSVASGQASFAAGYTAVAEGYLSTAIGSGANASGVDAIAIGYDAKSSGTDSTAIGRATIASGTRSTAIGYNVTTLGQYSTAIGREIEAGADYVFAIGLNDMNGFNCNQINSMCIMGGNVSIGTGNPAYLLEIANSAKAMNVSGNLYISSTNVGIGTDSPAEKLVVAGNTTIQGNLTIVSPGGGTPGHIWNNGTHLIID